MASTRRLAAILAADLAGYSRLMGADEEGTLERLKAHRRQLIDPKIAEHRGRIVKTTGDGLLAEFASVVDAVRCAAEVQRGMLDREPEVPDERRIRWRMGSISATASMLPRASKRSRSPAGSASPGRCATKYGTSCPTRWKIEASRIQEHRSTRTGLCAAPRSRRRSAGDGPSGHGAASPAHRSRNRDRHVGGARRHQERLVALAGDQTCANAGGDSCNVDRTTPHRAAPVDRRAPVRQSQQ